MYPDKKSAHDLHPRTFSATTWALSKLLVVGLVTASVALALYVRVDSKNSKAAVAVQAAGQSRPHLNVQSGQQLGVDFRGDQNAIQALQSGQAKARTLASADLDGDSAPDLLAGYGYGGVGIVTIQRGNHEAFAPKDESVYLRMTQGYNPDSLLPTAQTYQVPAAADFLQTGDFNNDSLKDVMVGAQGGDLFLLAGDGEGNLNAPMQVAISGVVTALAAGEFRAPDGRTDLAVGIDGPSGPQVLIYDGAEGVSGEPMRLGLTSRATGLEFGEMDDSPFMGLAIATGSEINVIHGWGRKQSPQLESRVEKIDTGMNVRGLASGFFVWSREGSKQLAALGDDGTIRIFGRGELNTQPLTDQEIDARARLRLQPKDTTEIDVETLAGWQSARSESWTKARELVTGNFVGGNATTPNLLRSAHISFTGTDDLMVLGSSSKVDIVRQVGAATSVPAGANLIGSDFTSTSLELTDAPATLALPQKLNGYRDLLVMEAGSVSPTVVPLAPTAIISVDRADDPTGAALTAASACTGAINDCSLRGAVQFANIPANAGSTINLSATTYTLNIAGNGGCVRETPTSTGNTRGDLEVNQTTTFVGAGQASTIINQIGVGTGPTFTGDRVLCMDVPLTQGLTFTFSAMTIVGGRDIASGIGGGGFIGGAKNTTLNLTNVTFANNQTTAGVPQGPVGGGGAAVTGGNMNVTNCTFGAANNPGASRTDLTLGNSSNTVSGGGISYSAGDPAGSAAATGTLAISGTTFTHNTSSSASAGGGGLDVKEFNTSVSTINVSTSAFTQNQATGTASGGGIINQSATSLNISTTSFTSNSAGNRGGGIYVGGGTTNLNGTVAGITFSGNTATTAGSSISAASAVNLSGTNTTIGGDLEITTNGIWTNQVGSAMSPTNFIMTGTANFIGNNSTTNVGGNFTFGSGTFTAGTSLFNFNGTTAQSISNASSIAFFNLTDSNVTQPLTLNNSFLVTGTLTVNGANAILAPVATAVIGNNVAGTLTGTGRVRVTRTGADSFFTQYFLPTRTLTNLTVEYIGAAAQGASVTTYSNLIINNGNGVTLGAGTTTVNNTLTLQTGALGVGTSTLVINNGTTVVGGSITSSPTGTVNYNQSSAGQDVRAFNYGNLTFSAFTKVLASTGTIGVSGTFNPNGVTTGHTIAGSTIDFNGTGAQTVPVFNFNNLTISGARGGATVTLASGIIGVAGTFTPSATTVVYSFSGNTFDFNGTGAQTVPVFNFNNLTISGNRGGAAITLASGSVGIAGVFNPSVTNNTFVLTGNTVVFNGNSSQTIPAFTFNGLTANNPATVSLGGAVIVGGAFTVTVGSTVAVLANTLTLNAAVSVSGALTSGLTGTVIYNQGSNGQAVVQANYGNLTFSNFSKTLASSGVIGIAGTFTPGTGTGHTITGSTIDFNGTGAQTIPGFTYNNLTSSGGAAARTLDPVNTIRIAGVFTPGTNVYTITGSTVEYNGSAAQTLPPTFTTYNNLTLNNPTTVLGFAGLTVQGLLRVQAGTFTSSSNYNNVQIDLGATMVATAGSTINVSGNWTNNGTFTPSTGTVVFNGANNTQTLAGSTTFNNLTGNHTGTGNVTSVGSTLAVTGLMRVQAGTFIVAAGTFNNVQIDAGATLQATTATTMNVSGNWTNNGGTFTPSGNTVNFNGAAAQSIGGSATTQNFDNFTVNKSGGSILSVAASTSILDINGNVTLTLGTFSAGTASAINVAGNWTNNATFTGGSGTVIFDGNDNTQTLAGNTTFNNLTINHTGTGGVTASGSTLTVTSLLLVQGGTFTSSSTFNNVQIESGGTLVSDGSTMNVSGNWTNNGGTFTPATGTVNFNGAAAQAINGTAASQTFNNFVVNKSAGVLSAGGSTTSITTNNLTMTLGAFTAPATLDINGNTLLTAGTLTAGANITAAGNWTNNGGAFIAGTGTVTFDGGVGQTIGGTTATTFGNLTNGNASGLAMAHDNTVNLNLALTASDITVAATKTLTQPASGTSSGTFDVNGRLLRTGFVSGGAALSFGNPLNTIQVTAGTAPANILVDLTRSVPTGVQGFPTAVQRTYTITPSAAGFTGTLRLRYLESELNGNVEGPEFIFRRFTSGIGWQPVLPTSSDFTNNWLEATGVTQFSPWTFNSTFAPTASNGVITGRIVDNDGAPVEGAVVRLEGTQNRKFITDSNGVYRFEKVETNGFYTVTPSRANYTFSPANRSFSQVGETTSAAFGATVASGGLVNPLDTPEYFVRQNYLDFLGREPDEAGFNFWSDQIIECGADQGCVGRRRENVSAAYFLSIEFRGTGRLVDGLYRAGFGVRPDFAQFMPDTRAIGLGVVVNKEGWEAKLQANKEAFVADFVNRSAFRAQYDGMQNGAFVDTLISHTGVSFTAGERDALVSGLNQGTVTRAQALTAIAENERFQSAKMNEAFVMMEYFGYLRRDTDADGFQFWLNKLNQFNGNFEQAEMVKAFIISGEYRSRFPR